MKGTKSNKATAARAGETRSEEGELPEPRSSEQEPLGTDAQIFKGAYHWDSCFYWEAPDGWRSECPWKLGVELIPLLLA